MDILKRLVVICFCLGSFILLFKGFLYAIYPDFTVYYLAEKTFIAGGNPYVHIAGIKETFLYAPIVFLCLLPILFFPLWISAKIWFLISLGLFVLSLLFLFRLIRVPLFSTKSFFFFGVSFLFFPAKFTMGMGQINMIILFLLVLGCYSVYHSKGFRAGILLGIATLIKPLFVFLFIYFLLTKQTKVLKGYIVSFLVSVCVMIVFINKNLLYTYLFQVVPSMSQALPKDYYNQGISGLIGNLLPTDLALLTIKCLVIVFTILTFIFILRTRKPQKQVFLLATASLIPLGLMLNSFSWQHHFVLMLVSYAFLYNFIYNKKWGRTYLIFLGVSALLVGWNIASPNAVPLLFRYHVLYGTFLTWIISLVLLYGYDTKHTL